VGENRDRINRIEGRLSGIEAQLRRIHRDRQVDEVVRKATTPPPSNFPPYPAKEFVANYGHRTLLAEALKDNLVRWPLLTKALREPAIATNPKVEWLISEPIRPYAEGDMPRTVEVNVGFNYTQIFRTVVKPRGESIQEALHRLMDEIEWAVAMGQRMHDTTGGMPIRTMGSVRQLLGRPPHQNDRISLHILRDLGLRGYYRYPNWSNELTREWLFEATVKATPGADAYRPLGAGPQ